jgi:hypothetical protein
LYDNERNAINSEEECEEFHSSIRQLKQQRMKALQELKENDLSKLRLRIAETTADLQIMVRSFLSLK